MDKDTHADKDTHHPLIKDTHPPPADEDTRR